MIQRYEIQIERREQYLEMKRIIEDKNIGEHLGIKLVDENYHLTTYHISTKNGGGVTMTAIYSPMSETKRNITIVGEKEGVEEVRLTLEKKLFPEIENRLEKALAQ